MEEQHDNLSPEGQQNIEERRQFVSQLPDYPREWQQNSFDDDEDNEGFDNGKLKVTANVKENEMKKLIKKYKRYMKSNLIEIKRLESE